MQGTLDARTLDQAVRTAVEAALREDLGQGDVTTDNLPELSRRQVVARLATRQDCVVSGLNVASHVFSSVDPALRFSPHTMDGTAVTAGSVLATVQGSLASVLKAERTALNFMQHLCGIATTTRAYVEKLAGTPTRLTHTRKTTPGLRLLEQQAVIHGGGYPHRYNLASAVMVKDNHLQGVGIAEAVRTLRSQIPHTMKIEVEADRLEQVQEAVEAGADIILLDNMTPAEIREALQLIDGRAITEASGGITLDSLRSYAETGVDVISTSKITLGVPAIDLGLDIG